METSLTVCKVGVFVVLMCLLHNVFTEVTHNRQKRGFRLNSASRVAHGYGKRAYSEDLTQDELTPFTHGHLESLSSYMGDNDGSLMTVDQLAILLNTHTNLARALIKKFIDLNGDGDITTDELFRPVLERR